jgi:hypothetical protein
LISFTEERCVIPNNHVIALQKSKKRDREGDLVSGHIAKKEGKGKRHFGGRQKQWHKARKNGKVKNYRKAK